MHGNPYLLLWLIHPRADWDRFLRGKRGQQGGGCVRGACAKMADRNGFIASGTFCCISPVYSFICRVWSVWAHELRDATAASQPKRFFHSTSLQLVDQFVLELVVSDKNLWVGQLESGREFSLFPAPPCPLPSVSSIFPCVGMPLELWSPQTLGTVVASSRELRALPTARVWGLQLASLWRLS